MCKHVKSLVNKVSIIVATFYRCHANTRAVVSNHENGKYKFGDLATGVTFKTQDLKKKITII